ncbi:MAG: metallophosphoesterase [Flavobacteriaceae bacterium]|nr:metallophosphoesterase [Flavobacteriaceae bacterium]
MRIHPIQLILFFLAVQFSFAQTQQNKIYTDLEKIKNAVTFTAIGDWGRNGYYNQKETGSILGETMNHIGGDFIVSVGDNFYPHGVGSTQDHHWLVSFENVYEHPGTWEDWYVILGNHDYNGNVQAQIDYSQISRRWHMPDRYYSKTIEDGNNKILLLFIDTNPFVDSYLKHPEKKYSDVDAQDKNKQMTWIQKTLSESDAHWKIVIGHHQLFTGGRRENADNSVRTQLLPLFKQQNIDLYICGHEHHLEYGVYEGIHQIISGAGSSVRVYNGTEGSVFGKSIQGFATVAITQEAINFNFIDYLGNVIHANKITK